MADWELGITRCSDEYDAASAIVKADSPTIVRHGTFAFRISWHDGADPVRTEDEYLVCLRTFELTLLAHDDPSGTEVVPQSPLGSGFRCIERSVPAVYARERIDEPKLIDLDACVTTVDVLLREAHQKLHELDG
jgi:hypothetical protein